MPTNNLSKMVKLYTGSWSGGSFTDSTCVWRGFMCANAFTQSWDKQKKVVEIEALDAPFDENLHEAVARFAAGEEKRGKVIDVVERGYMLGDKVLRFAKVVGGD